MLVGEPPTGTTDRREAIMPTGTPRRAQSLYRQLRLTATQETGGTFSYSIYGKPMTAQWSEHQCLLRGKITDPGFPLNSTEDVIVALVAILEDQLLPKAVD